ncbi:hypothetical protein IFM53868_07916 [Aspergillus udagawae]|uniref:Alpha/beta hydrolase n=1 Tax=Aspergillus udagawae TaxID=91492 RepID=A0ABQ1B7A7_9EURO|nr:hypothetical protein IFM53868_07916 [Aspergillus udagawae]GFG14766.1 hypothetical protein IFM5058_07114 [Aspergillus udagawae]
MTQYEALNLTVDNVQLSSLITYRPGAKQMTCFLHSFGSCKERLHGILHLPAFAEHTFLAYDAPGCSTSSSSDLSKNYNRLPDIYRAGRAGPLRYYSLRPHRPLMVGLTALMLAHIEPARISFINQCQEEPRAERLFS